MGTEPTSELTDFHANFFFQSKGHSKPQSLGTVLNQTCDAHILPLHNIMLLNIN